MKKIIVQINRPKAFLVCVGSELLAGQVNTHQAWLSLRLRSAGYAVAGEISVPDSVAQIGAAVDYALSQADSVIICGGLGPTFDDLTREAVAKVLSRTLVFEPKLWAKILRLFSRRYAIVPEENKRQAYRIQGAEILDNKIGSAPGQFIRVQRHKKRPMSLALLPGPYSEMSVMFDKLVLPKLMSVRQKNVFAKTWTARMAGVAESVADERLSAVRSRFPAADYTILASGGEVSFHATAWAKSPSAAAATLAPLRHMARVTLAPWVYGEGNASLESVIGDRLKSAGLTLSAAESCTAGLLSSRLTSVPGASAWFNGGVSAYSDRIKMRILGVDAGIIRRHGAVSSECALAMAKRVKDLFQTSIGVGITGIAGPGGGSAAKPVGLVHIAISGPTGLEKSVRFEFSGAREVVRQRAVTAALTLLEMGLRQST